MPLRFRRTIKVAPGVKLNLSKGGVSTTVGSKGFHFNIGKHGVRRTVSIPGTGISETDYIEKKETASEKKREAASERRREDVKEHSESHSNVRHVRRQEAASNSSSGLKTAFVIIGAVVFFIVGAVALGLMPADFITNSLQFLTHAVQSTVH